MRNDLKLALEIYGRFRHTGWNEERLDYLHDKGQLHQLQLVLLLPPCAQKLLSEGWCTSLILKNRSSPAAAAVAKFL